MKSFKTLTLFTLSVLTAAATTSCREHDVFSEEKIFQQEYSENFFKTYGNFPANQSWDFSNAPRTAPTDPSIFDLGYEDVVRAATRATQPTINTENGQYPHWIEANVEYTLEQTKSAGKLSVPAGTAGSATDPYYYVEKGTIEWLDANIVEGKNNTPIGTPFTLNYSTPSKFALIPIYQGIGSVKYKLHMVSKKDNIDYVVWDNWGLTEKDKFQCYTPPYVNDVDQSVGTDDFQYNWTEEYPAPHNSSYWRKVEKGNDLQTLQKKNIRSKPLLINNMDGEFYFYLEVTSCLLGHGRVGQHHSSREGMMLTLNCPVPEDINNYKNLFGIEDTETISNVMVIGCEDSKQTDWDINDIVFLYVGLMNLPTKIEAKHSKRYLFEDMGTTVDFDFNDVVVDVTEAVAIESDGTETILTQEAVLRHKCGTLPFQVYFVDSDGDKRTYGNYAAMNGEVQGLNEQYTYKDSDDKLVRMVYTAKAHSTVDQTKYILSEYPFWDAATNNIRIDVGTNGTLTGEEWKKADGNSRIMTGHFNRPGETGAPYIIAVPTTQMWTRENEDFPITTFTELPSSNN